MKWSKNEDDLISCALHQEAKQMEEDKNLYGRIKEQIYIKEREKDTGNRKIGKKHILIAAIVMAVTSGTILAGGMGGWERKAFKFYENLPSQEQLKKDGDFTPKFAKELPGGYTFLMASLEKQELIDQYNKVTDEGNEFILRYYSKEDKEGSPVLSFHASDIDQGFDNHQLDRVSEVYKGNTLYFCNCIRKYVSMDYKPTAEEQKKIDDKELIITNMKPKELSKIPLEMREELIQGIGWKDGNVYYTLMSMNHHHFKEKQLVDMAKTVIDAE